MQTAMVSILVAGDAKNPPHYLPARELTAKNRNGIRAAAAAMADQVKSGKGKDILMPLTKGINPLIEFTGM